ncbi:hypothetical protein F5884DRAFT_858635 [Xylogone sp. PMI_703]|nr:hypothetical protein F5884DRAFT_858635 [Xylogone sp. PMI_703]
MSVVSVSQIPTLSALYRSKKLSPLAAGTHGGVSVPQPSQTLNNQIGLIKGDITKLEVDAIVNAANSSLRGGGGVDGAIHAAAGHELLLECRKLGGCETGSAKITGGYKLPCKKIIHAVGPVFYDDEEEDCAKALAGCYKTGLQLAVENDCKSLAFSAISTGIYGYPNEAAAKIAIQTVRTFLESEDGPKLEKVIFCTFTQRDDDAYHKLLPAYFPPTEEDQQVD